MIPKSLSPQSVSSLATLAVLAFASVASAQAAQPTSGPTAGAPRPAVMRPPPPLLPFESNFARGATAVARWDLANDSTNTRYVMAQTRASNGDQECVLGAVVNNTWVVDRWSIEQTVDTPTICFSGVQVGNRWVFAKWTLGGHGDGAQRVNEGGVELVALVQGRFARVYQANVSSWTMLSSASLLQMPVSRTRTVSLTWAPDNSALVEFRAPGRTPPRR